MAAYIVSIIKVLDPDRFAAWRRDQKPMAAAFGGSPLLRGDVVQILEGEGDGAGETVAVVRFPDADSARRMIAAEEYLEGVGLRKGIAQVIQRLVVEP